MPLSDVATVVNGGTPKSKVAEYWGGDVQWLTPKDMGQMEGREISETPRTITQAGLKGSSARLVPSGSVILSTRAPIGHLGMNTVPMAFNQGCRGIVPSDKLDPVYLYHFLNMSRDLLNELGSGTTFKELSATNLKSVKVPLPPLEEQQRIVAVLDEAFEGLARARAHAEANLQNARELFESHLVDLFTHPDSSWQYAQLKNYCENITVGHVGPMAKRYVSTGTPFLRSQNVRPFKIDLTDVKYIDVDFTKELEKSELRPGDVAIVRTGYPGTCAVIPDDLELANCADLVIARTGPNLNPHFLALLLNSTYGKELVAGASVGAAQKHFNVGAAKTAIFPFPPLSDQERLVAQADEINAACNSIAAIAEEKLQDLDDLRQSLLQKAFAGELT